MVGVDPHSSESLLNGRPGSRVNIGGNFAVQQCHRTEHAQRVIEDVPTLIGGRGHLLLAERLQYAGVEW